MKRRFPKWPKWPARKNGKWLHQGFEPVPKESREMRVCPKCERPVFDSWFLFKPKIRTHEVCHNAESKLCEKCEEPECAGQVYPKEAE